MSRLQMMFAPKDMTEGPPWKRILTFAIPLLIGNIAQQFYNTVDAIIVGKYVGDNALASVGGAGPILNLLLVLFSGVSMGATIMVSQYYGAKDRRQLSKTIGTCITLTIFTSIIIMIIGPLVTRPLLAFLNTPSTIIDWCEAYLNIMFMGIAGFSFYNILAGILRGLGDSFSALIYLLISTALNVGLDILFVTEFGLGVPGVALATIIAQSISAGLCMLKLTRMKTYFDLKWSLLKPNKYLSMSIMKLGLPAGLTQAIFSMALIVMQSLINSFGEMVIACNVIVMRVDGFAMMPNFSFGSAMTTFAGQNIGARRIDRLEQGTKQGLMMAVGMAVIITLTLLLFGQNLMKVFTDTEELVNLSMRMMRILAAGYIAMAFTQSLSGVMRGAGDTLTPMLVSIVTILCIRVPLAYRIAHLTKSPMYPTGRPESTFIALLVSWTLGAIITSICYKMGTWRRKGLTGPVTSAE
jgi:putative MATE family efflux protein